MMMAVAGARLKDIADLDDQNRMRKNTEQGKKECVEE